MSAEENTALIRRWMEECFNPARFDRMEEFFAPDFVNHDRAAPQVGDLESLKQLFKMQFAGFPDLHATIEELVAEGDKVVKRTTVRGTHTGEFAGIPPTGKQMTLMTISIYRCSAGKIREIWWGYDNLSVLQQLGVVPMAEQAA